MERTHRTSRAFRIFAWVMAVVCTVLVLMFPFAVLMLWLAYKARVTVTDEHLVIVWLGTRRIRWDDIASVKPASLRGGVGLMMEALLRPHEYQLRSKPEARERIAIGAYADGERILEEIRRRAGLAAPSSSST